MRPFGRTPIMQRSKGRDHHPYGFSVWMAGGGIRGGKTFGATDDFGFGAVEDKVHVNDLHATMLSLMGLDHNRLTYGPRHKKCRIGIDVKSRRDDKSRHVRRNAFYC